MRLLLSLILAAAAAVGLGFGLFLLDSQGFYLVGLMPLLGGAILGFVVRLPVPLTWTRTAPLMLIALLAALGMMAVYWYLQYDAYQNTIVATVQENQPSITREEVLSRIDEVQMETYGVSGFPAFVMDYAETGFTIGRVGSSDSSSLEFKGNLAYGFWIFELVIAVAMAAFSARNKRGHNKPAEAVST